MPGAAPGPGAPPPRGRGRSPPPAPRGRSPVTAAPLPPPWPCRRCYGAEEVTPRRGRADPRGRWLLRPPAACARYRHCGSQACAGTTGHGREAGGRRVPSGQRAGTPAARPRGSEEFVLALTVGLNPRDSSSAALVREECLLLPLALPAAFCREGYTLCGCAELSSLAVLCSRCINRWSIADARCAAEPARRLGWCRPSGTVR